MARSPRTPKDEARYHHGDLARAAVAHGLDALDALGVEGVGASEIARRAGVTHAAVYKQLGGRDALLEALAAACMGELRDVMLRAANASSGAPRQRFLDAGWGVARYAWRHPHRYRLLFAGPGVTDPSELGEAPRDTPFGTLRALVESWQAARLLRAGDPLELAFTIFSTTHGIASLLASGRLGVRSERRARELVDRIHVALLDGLAR